MKRYGEPPFFHSHWLSLLSDRSPLERDLLLSFHPVPEKARRSEPWTNQTKIRIEWWTTIRKSRVFLRRLRSSTNKKVKGETPKRKEAGQQNSPGRDRQTGGYLRQVEIHLVHYLGGGRYKSVHQKSAVKHSFLRKSHEEDGMERLRRWMQRRPLWDYLFHSSGGGVLRQLTRALIVRDQQVSGWPEGNIEHLLPGTKQSMKQQKE